MTWPHEAILAALPVGASVGVFSALALQATSDVSYSVAALGLAGAVLVPVAGVVTVLWRKHLAQDDQTIALVREANLATIAAQQVDIAGKLFRITRLDEQNTELQKHIYELQQQTVSMLTTIVSANTVATAATASAMDEATGTLRNLRDLLLAQQKQVMGAIGDLPQEETVKK